MPTALSPVHQLTFLGPLLLATNHCIPSTHFKTWYSGGLVFFLSPTQVYLLPNMLQPLIGSTIYLFTSHISGFNMMADQCILFKNMMAPERKMCRTIFWKKKYVFIWLWIQTQICILDQKSIIKEGSLNDNTLYCNCCNDRIYCFILCLYIYI